MTKVMLLTAMFAALVMTTIPAFAQGQIEINDSVDLKQIAIVIGIGLAGAIITSLEGMHKSGTKFDLGKFIIAVKRTAVISIPATLAMLALYPEPTIGTYFVIGMAIVLGAKMQHSKPEETTSLQKTSSSKNAKSIQSAGSATEVLPTANLVIPKLGPAGAKYQTNFINSKDGNALLYGTDLWIRRTGVRSYVTAILRDAAGNVIQIDQSHLKDEDGDIETTRLEMRARDGQPLPRGKYSVETFGDSGTSDGTGTNPDVFLII